MNQLNSEKSITFLPIFELEKAPKNRLNIWIPMKTPFDALLAILANLDNIVQEIPDFDVEDFYELAKKINAFINDPKFEEWAQIISEGTLCKAQVLSNQY